MRCEYSCRGWVTVEYTGGHFDGSPDKVYQRSDAIIGISETDQPHKYVFEVAFRQTGFEAEPWPDSSRTMGDIRRSFDKIRKGEVCSQNHWQGTVHFKGKPLAECIDPRNGNPMCVDCYEELTND